MSYKLKEILDPPARFEINTVYIFKDGKQYLHAALICPCGCKEKIYLNLLKDTDPFWKIRKTKRGKATISPSIWRTSGCESHFFIRKGELIWAKSFANFTSSKENSMRIQSKKSKSDIDINMSKYQKSRIQIRQGSNECFHNCLHNQGYIADTIYVEGWITVLGERMQHAWLEHEGRIIEVTLNVENDPDYDTIIYEGVNAFTQLEVLRELEKKGQDISDMFCKVVAPVGNY